MSRGRLRGSLRRDDGGAVTVEFALVFPLALLLIGALLSFGLRSLWQAGAGYTARDLARYASIACLGGTVNPTYPDMPLTAVTSCSGGTPQTLAQRANGELGGWIGTPTSVTSVATNGTDRPHVGDLVSVTVTYRVPGVTALTGFVNAIPGLGSLDLTPLATVSATATARRE